ncbi:DNA replication ATP-dependent helicase dna2 [Gaeumannomyces tritici R3-111a-1]|uniref:DNA replication ATP-dependent helicase/nuclease n=1 Tax=Gaeumannomyces tritici (strain R3-111a-1) TaxID=644352 RepID=J3NH80_GAET3|nr:DNA replication ATP-dependent helicase dna2 [Gaeumannomyces tritici R3-111a-1]EJT80623.1 DNA replication ATP-dependent helicase dna2 [Gaeumannomyces tritici R3-111a-1]
MPLQKTLSDQGALRTHTRKQQWRRSESHPAAARQSSRPLPLVSAATKTKLTKFRFEEPNVATTTESSLPAMRRGALTTTEDGSDKENHEADSAGSSGKPRPHALTSLPPGVATTPVAKLAWQDLVRMGEVNTIEEQEETSPSDKLLWDKPYDPEDSFISPLLPRKGAKRARSSSPVSSPASPNFDTPLVNVKGLTSALRSPRADPAMDLWDRFSTGRTSKNTPLGAADPALAHLFVASSPRPAKGAAAALSDSSLRRAASCGNNWPKRRRIGNSTVDSPTSRLRHAAYPDSKSSLVSDLLETVTGELEKSNASQHREMMQRSPSPEKRRASPTRQRPAEGADVPAFKLPTKPPSSSSDTALEEDETEKPVDKSSDYGDDDFDDDTLMELDSTVGGAKATVPPPEPAPRAQPAPPAIQRPKQSLSASADFDDDDFDDLDDDLFSAAETLMTQIESKPPPQCPPQNLSACGGPRPIQTTKAQTISHARGKNNHPSSGHGGGGGAADKEGEDAYGDDFDGDFDFDAVELAATQSARQPAAAKTTASTAARPARATGAASSLPFTNPSQKPRAIQRYLVTRVLDASYVDDNHREKPERILVVRAERTNFDQVVHLREDWLETPATVDSYVHVIGEFEESGMCVVDNSHNMLILHPDQLISATVVADSFGCIRRAVLQDRVKATGEASAPMVYGTMLHEIFQEALMANKWDSQFLAAVVDTNMERHLEDLYVIKVSLADAREHLLSKMKEMRQWAESFVSAFPRSDAVVQGRHGDKANMCVSKLLDVEEHVWSPMYGLKGNIDATVQVTMRDGNDRRTLTVPFEVKTGKNVVANHQAQTALYNLLLSDRYDIEIVFGVLYYMETSQTMRIPAVRHELRHMIMQRNQLACYARERSVQLPPMKKAKNMCGRCYAQTSCFIYHKLADDGDGETSGMEAKFDEVVKHLSTTHKEFFLKWEDLLTKEERESQKLRRELWTMLSSEREKLGRCFGNVVIEPGSAVEDKDTPKINRFQYTFVKDNAGPAFSFLESQLAVGEPIVVSDEQGHFALALGFVTAVRKRRITVAVDRRLHNSRIRQPGFDEVNNQVFASIMEVGPAGTADSQQSQSTTPSIRYRLDKDEFSSGMATVRNNLVHVMSNGLFGSREIRRLVVDLEAPTFKSAPTQYEITGKESLNSDQQKAIEKVMGAKDYALVLGMPGTGKTTTIAHIIRALHRQGKSVLLASYTHSAVDNILLKLKKDNMQILRLGAPAKVHPEVQEFATLAAQPKKSFEEIRSAWHDSPVVATTCLGVNHAVFNERTFDYCIVDEASQITLPVCLGPIRMARTFVLVGDHNQLPPLVQNEEARRGGLDVSLFKLLSDTHPDSVVNLEHQYRMCEDIMTLSNTLIYNGRLKCGTKELRFHKLHVPDPAALTRHHYDASSFLALSKSQPAAAVPKSFCTGGAGCWLGHLLDPETRVAFVNTDALPDNREEAKGNRIVNPVEAQLVVQLVEALMTVGVPASEIGVMTHYRSQLALLRHKLHRGSSRPGQAAAVEMHTADRFQGRDKEVVVLSLVRNNEDCKIGELLRDWRRINVAFTRAKTKLLVIGSLETLQGCGADQMLSRFVQLMNDRHWICNLPADALSAHVFDDGAGVAATGTTAFGSPPAARTAARRTPKKRISPGGGSGWQQVSPTTAAAPNRKENAPLVPQGRGPRKANIGERALMQGKPLLRDILNDMMPAGGY